MRVLSLQSVKVAGRCHFGVFPSRRNIASSNPWSGFKNETTEVKPYEDLPGPRGINNVPILGLALKMKPFGNYSPETFPYLLSDLVDQYGPILKLHTTTPSVIITDPKDIATMVRSEGKYPFRPSVEIFEVYSKRTGTPLNMQDRQGEDWWHLRSPMSKVMMKPTVIAHYLPEMNEVADDLVDMLAKGYLHNRDPENFFMAYAAESVGSVCFNKRLGFMQHEPTQEIKDILEAVGQVFTIIQHSVLGTSFSYKFYRSKEYNQFEAILNFFSQKMSEFVQDSMDTLRKNNFDDDSFLNFVLKNNSFQEVRMIMESAFFGAIETTAAAIQAFLHTLGKNQDKQEKLQTELRNVLGNHNLKGRFITDQNIRDLPYLRACIKEVYRMCPIAPTGSVRRLPTDTVLGGYKIPAGVQVMAHTMKTCQNESIFENPDKFQPERWLRNSSKLMQGGERNISGDLAKKWSVIPFGMGHRSCPGRRIFEQELYVVMAKLIHRLKVGLEPESQDIGFEYRLFRKPSKQIKFTFTPVEFA